MNSENSTGPIPVLPQAVESAATSRFDTPGVPWHEKEYVTIEDIALRLGVTLHAVRAWRRDRKLPPPYRFGKLLRWRRPDIEIWERSRKEKPNAGMIKMPAFQKGHAP